MSFIFFSSFSSLYCCEIRHPPFSRCSVKNLHRRSLRSNSLPSRLACSCGPVRAVTGPASISGLVSLDYRAYVRKLNSRAGTRGSASVFDLRLVATMNQDAINCDLWPRVEIGVKPSHALQLYTRPSLQAFLTPYHWSNMLGHRPLYSSKRYYVECAWQLNYKCRYHYRDDSTAVTAWLKPSVGSNDVTQTIYKWFIHYVRLTILI